MKQTAVIAKQFKKWACQVNAIACIRLLLFLTVANYYVYSNAETKTYSVVLDEDSAPQTEDSNSGNPAGPDEKAPNGPTLTEEYCHEATQYEFDITIDHKHNWFFLLKKDKQLSYPTITPPPDQI
ncbi:MAG: hypothetical protein K2P88_17405 [Chitinophagaceae bacterium]|nr:hypothetical protein [Chitinophagaceae bacterium]